MASIPKKNFIKIKKRGGIMKGWNDMSIKVKLIIVFLALSLVPITIVGLIAFNNAQNAIIKEVENKLDAVAFMKQESILNYFNRAERDVEIMALSLDARETTHALIKYHLEMDISAEGNFDTSSSKPGLTRKWSDIARNFDSYSHDYTAKFNYYDVFIICAKHGHVMYSYAKESDLGENIVTGKLKDSPLHEVWRKAIDTGKTAISEMAYYAPSSAPAMFIASPIYDNGEIISIAVIQISNDALDRIVQEEKGLGKTGDVYLVGPDYMMRSNSRLSTEKTQLRLKVETKGSKEAFRTKSEFDGIYGDYTTESDAKTQGRRYDSKMGGVPVKGMAIYLEKLNWVLMSEIDIDEMFENIESLKAIIITIALITAVIVALIALFIALSIAGPIKKLEVVSSKMASGDLTVTLDSTILKSNDEVGKLANSFNFMLENLKKLVTNITMNANTAAATAEELSASAEEVNASTEQVSSTIQEIAKGGQTLSKSANDTKQEAEMLISTIKEVTQAAQDAAKNATQANDAAKKGGVAAGKAGQKMKQISDSVTTSAVVVKELGLKSQQINKVIDVINSISEQTNLLALNAAIEAARAGEAGRGFAVVADEVRKLAEESQKATKQIETMIEEIATSTKNAVDSMEKGSKDVAEGSAVVNEALTSLDIIEKAVSSLAAQVEEISASTEQQLAGSERVQKSVQDVSSVAEESAASTETVSSSIEETTASMQQVATAAQSLAKSADELKQLIAQFKIVNNDLSKSQAAHETKAAASKASKMTR